MSAMNVAETWAKAGIAEPDIADKLRANFRALILQSLEPGGTATVTSATKNGVSMGKAVGLSIPETMEAMRIAIKWIDDGAVPCRSRSYARF